LMLTRVSFSFCNHPPSFLSCLTLLSHHSTCDASPATMLSLSLSDSFFVVHWRYCHIYNTVVIYL
jgi:hypothetical protein